ncbi:MAG: threonyl-tRNA synthetase editing domain-containing protein [Candidatus Nanohaloarchaea archaeon]|nr:threonyl-tRNA synthetase editing domain-containing protein [Candidatus Nanohaloarchaea archaeon]
MKQLFNHVSRFRYRAVEETEMAEELEDERLEQHEEQADEGRSQEESQPALSEETGEALLVKICSEPGDEADDAIPEIVDTASDLGLDTVILFPWAHLSQDLMSPPEAKELLEDVERNLEERGYDVIRAPFGWYKEWELESKGHPMSVLSRET